MCMITATKRPIVAKEDLVCYKVVGIKKETGEMISPYMAHPLYMGSNKPSGCPRRKRLDSNLWMASGGWIHAFVNFRTADKRMKAMDTNIWKSISWNNPPYNKLAIVKCVIPKGAKYMTGDIGDVCASELIIENREN